MDTTVVVAIITVVGSIVVALITGWVALRTHRASEKLKGQNQIKAIATNSVLGRVATYEVREFEATTIFDESGSGEHVRRWIGVSTTQTITNLRIPCKFRCSNGGHQIPAVSMMPGSELSVHWETTIDSANELEGMLILEGLLSPQIGYVGVEAHHGFTSAFETTKEGALARYKASKWQTEYAVSELTSPAKVMKRSVVFPPSHHRLTPPPKAVVFIGTTEEPDTEEMARVRSGLTVLDGIATLIVNDPKPGRFYGISWMPPPALRP